MGSTSFDVCQGNPSIFPKGHLWNPESGVGEWGDTKMFCQVCSRFAGGRGGKLQYVVCLVFPCGNMTKTIFACVLCMSCSFPDSGNLL